MENLFFQFAPVIRDVSDTELAAETASPRRLLIDSAPHGQKRLDVAYAPFDHVNMAADVVIVGITPGRQQMRNALMEARRLLREGRSEAEAMEAAKVFASFSGPMRANLVAMLDSIGVNRLLGPILSTPLLRAHLMKWFAMEMRSLPNAIFVPLGPKVAEAVEVAAQERGVDQERVLAGLPHPSGANAERIAFFLGRKDRDDLSAKVVPERLLAARAAVEAKIGILAD
jgi:hypothetical protein